MRRHLVPLALVGLVGCGKSGGIAGIPGIERYLPQVSFDRLAIKDVSFEKVDTAVVLAVRNPYPLKVSLASFAWDLSLDGHHLVGGKGKNGLTLDPSGTSRVRVPVSVAFRDLVDLVGVGKGKDQVPFTVTGSMGFDTPLGQVKLPWRGKGAFPVLRVPRVKLAGLRLKNLDVGSLSATLALDLALSHDQGSTLTFHGLDYGLSFGGHHVLDGKVEKVAAVAPGATSTVSLPLTVSLVAVGSTVADAIRSHGALDVGFDAKVQVDTPIGTVPLGIDERGKLTVGR
jgi:LEA14-like dessication related protein